MGFIVPRDIAKQLGLKAGDEVTFEIDRVGIKDAFGSMKDWDVDPQRLKREAREGW